MERPPSRRPWRGRDDDSAGHLARILARAVNAGALDAGVLRLLRTALAHHSELHSCRYRRGRPRPLNRRTLKHVFLLPDGSSPVLWELIHDTEPDGRHRHELYLDEADLFGAELDVDARFGGPEPWGPDSGLPCPEADMAFAAGPSAAPRSYVADHSAEHAWRVLRRAENGDRPGADTRALLRSAIAHDIVFVTRRSSRVAGREVGWSLYEHAFLLIGGRECSLWEVEDSMAPDGLPRCEVYATEQAARDAADRRLESL